MRFVRIKHSRCGDYDGTEYVLAPDAWTDRMINSIIHEARDEMIADAKKLKEAVPDPGYRPSYEDFPSMTVAEVRENYRAQKGTYEARRKENAHLTRSLQDRLEERGFEKLWKTTDAVAVAVDWGHSHGLELNYRHLELPN